MDDDDCCFEMCKDLVEYELDEQTDQKKYHEWAEKAREHGQPLISAIFDTISTDEGKHAKAITEMALVACKGILLR